MLDVLSANGPAKITSSPHLRSSATDHEHQCRLYSSTFYTYVAFLAIIETLITPLTLLAVQICPGEGQKGSSVSDVFERLFALFDRQLEEI